MENTNFLSCLEYKDLRNQNNEKEILLGRNLHYQIVEMEATLDEWNKPTQITVTVVVWHEDENGGRN